MNAGRVEGVVVTFAGISEMKAAERTIEAAKAFAEGVITTVKQPLAVLDKDLSLISASPSFFRAFGINAQDCTGKPFTLAGPREAEILARVLEPARRGEPIEDLEQTFDLGALGERTLHLSAREIAGGDPPDGKILVSIDDVTDAKARSDALAAARDEAEHANWTKSNFLAAASHDLRQPLQTMSLLLGMLQDLAKDPSGQKLIGRIEHTIASMSSLLDKLLDINQLEAGVVSPRPDDFEINDMLAQLHSEFGIHAANDGLILRFVPCHLTVRTDPRLLEQILRNMISNAIKYTGRGRILLGARRRGDRLTIEVWDTGTGIPEDKLASIFKEGHQLRNRIPRRARGLGLGLSIVQRLADLLGLPVKVRSWVGHGSVFSVEVPIVDRPARISALHRRTATPRLQDKPRGAMDPSGAILLLEDDVELRGVLQLLLESRGFPVLAAADEQEALAIAASRGSRITLVIADYNMPGSNGLEVVEKLEDALGRKLPVIFLTGDISAATLVEIASARHMHLYKPVEPAVLVSHIERVLRAVRRKAEVEKIFVVDDNDEFREAMRDMLEMHDFQVGLFPDANALLAAEDLAKARCVIADVHMPGMSGPELAGRLAEIAPSLPVIVVTGYGDVATAVEAMKSGAFDFLEKPVQPDELIERIERALRSVSQQHELLAEKETAAATIAKLTIRQREVLDLVLKGAPSKNIAADLNISQRTVENHRAAIMRKFGVHSIPGLVRIALAAQSQ
jgi:two-component system CheB/CheR fusion protein